MKYLLTLQKEKIQMEETNPMMHYSQGYGMGLSDGQQQAPTSPQSAEDVSAGAGGQEAGVRGHASINNILDQILTITDQSLDEAQVFLFAISCLIEHSTKLLWCFT